LRRAAPATIAPQADAAAKSPGPRTWIKLAELAAVDLAASVAPECPERCAPQRWPRDHHFRCGVSVEVTFQLSASSFAAQRGNRVDASRAARRNVVREHSDYDERESRTGKDQSVLRVDTEQ
jgi:hypothetical protein